MSTVLIDGNEVDRAAWLAERQSGIGASETPILLGLKPGLMQLYLSKRGDLPPSESSEEQAWGLRLEDDIAEAYLERTGRAIARTQVFLGHPDIPWMTATLDGLTECGRVVEFKSVGPFGAGRDLGRDGESETLPDAWVVQANQQMAIAAAHGLASGDEADVAVFGPGLRLRIFTVKRNDTLIELSAEAIRRFWVEHILRGVPPAEVAPEDAEHLARAFRRESGEVIALDGEAAEAAVEYHETGRAIRELEARRSRAKARLLLALGDASGGTTPGGFEVSRKVVEVKEHVVRGSTQVRLSVREPK